MKRWLILIVMTIAGLAALVLVDNYYRRQIRQENAQALEQTVEDFQNGLSLAIQLRLVAVEDLKTFMLTPPTLPDSRTFDRFAAGLLANYPTIRAAQYTDTDRIIRYIYPLAGNEAALNLDLKTNPSAPFVEKAIRERRTTVSNPIITVQGSLSIVARAPLYRSDELLGLAQGVFDISEILEEATTNLNSPYKFQLHDSLGAQFWGAETIAGDTRTVEVPVGDDVWTLTLGWDTPPHGLNPLTLLLIWGGGGLLLLSLLFIVNQSGLKTEWLATAVAEQTAELSYQANLLQNVFDAIVATDLDFVIQSWNKAAETIYGWPAGEAIGQRMAELVPTSYPEDEAEVVMAQILRQGFWQGELIQQRQDGTTIHILASVSLLRDEGGEPVGTVAVNRDITQRKQAQEALQSSQAHLEMAQAEARVGSWELHLERQTGFWSKEMFRLFRRDPAAGPPLLDEFFGLVNPNDVAQLQAAHARAIETAQQTFIEYRTHPSHGPVRYLLATIQVVQYEAGQPVSLIGTVQDITKRKQAEQALRESELLLNETGKIAKIGGWEFDPVTLEGTWTDEVARIHELDPDQPTGVELGLSFYHGESRKMIENAVRDAIELGKSYDLELEIITAKGNLKWIRTSGIPLKEGNNVVKVRGIFQDITEQKLAEAALRESEERFRTAFEFSANGMCLTSMDGRLQQVNKALCDMLGYKKEELEGNHFNTITHPEDLEIGNGAIREILAGEIPSVSYEKRYLRKNGHPIWVHINATLLKDNQGNFRYFITQIENITERKQAEKALQQYNERLTLLREIDRDIIAARSPEAIATVVLQRLRRLISCQRARVILFDESANEILIFAGDIDHASAWQIGSRLPYVRNQSTERLQSGQFLVIPDLGLLEDHNTPLIEAIIKEGLRSLLGAPLLVQEQLIGVLILLADTPGYFTAEHQEVVGEVANQVAIALHQARLQEQIERHTVELEEHVAERTAALQIALDRTETLYQVAQSLILPGDLPHLLQGVVDNVAEVLPANRVSLLTFDHNAQEITRWVKGGPGASEILPVSYVELLDGLSGWVLRESRPALSPKGLPDPREPPAVQQRRLETNCGAIIVVPLKYEGQILGTLTAINSPDEPDFTEQDMELMMALAHQSAISIIKVGLQESLIQAKEQAEAADRLKSVFLATMSHELRTPLNSIIGFTGIMLQGLAGPLAPEQSKQLGMVRTSANHLLALINDVLDLSKIEAGQMELAIEPVDMRQVIERVSQMTVPLAHKQGLALQIEIAPEVGRVRGDRRRLEQVLINLVNNALKFTEQGEVRIGCKVSDGQVVTQVSDTGIGLKPEDLNKLFKPFQQLETGLARRREGSGLGLSICQKLVILMGGQISAASDGPGRGSTFTFALPKQRNET